MLLWVMVGCGSSKCPLYAARIDRVIVRNDRCRSMGYGRLGKLEGPTRSTRIDGVIDCAIRRRMRHGRLRKSKDPRNASSVNRVIDRGCCRVGDGRLREIEGPTRTTRVHRMIGDALPHAAQGKSPTLVGEAPDVVYKGDHF